MRRIAETHFTVRRGIRGIQAEQFHPGRDGDRNDGLFRVLVGPWPDPNAAERSRQAVIARGYADALLISAR